MLDGKSAAMSFKVISFIFHFSIPDFLQGIRAVYMGLSTCFWLRNLYTDGDNNDDDHFPEVLCGENTIEFISTMSTLPGLGKISRF